MITMGNTTITPRLGQIVLYTLTDADVREIMQRRREAGTANRRGNDVREGDTYPAIVVRDWIDPVFLEKVALGKVTRPDGTPLDYEAYRDDISVNLQVFLDGNDTYWATSRSRRTQQDIDEYAEHFPALHAEHPLSRKGTWTDEPIAW